MPRACGCWRNEVAEGFENSRGFWFCVTNLEGHAFGGCISERH